MRMRFMVTTNRRDRKARTFKYAAYVIACLFSVGLVPDAGAAQASSGTWAPASSIAQARAGADNPSGIRRSLETFDPATGSFSSAGLLSSRRKDHAAALLPDGRVLLVGGSNGTATLASTDVFNPKDNTVSRGPNLSSGRSGASATTLLNGNVLVAGGSNGSTDLASAEVYDPAGNRFSPTAGALETARR